jgi:hypothetical protein
MRLFGVGTPTSDSLHLLIRVLPALQRLIGIGAVLGKNGLE